MRGGLPTSSLSLTTGLAPGRGVAGGLQQRWWRAGVTLDGGCAASRNRCCKVRGTLRVTADHRIPDIANRQHCVKYLMYSYPRTASIVVGWTASSFSCCGLAMATFHAQVCTMTAHWIRRLRRFLAHLAKREPWPLPLGIWSITTPVLHGACVGL